MLKLSKRNEILKTQFLLVITHFRNKNVEIVVYTIKIISTDKKNLKQFKYIAPVLFERRRRAVITTRLSS